MSIIYRLQKVIRRYGPRTAVELDYLEVSAGDALAVIGPNGSGKSTLLRLMAFLETPDQGTIGFYGAPDQESRRQVTLLLQQPYLLKRSVYENVAYGLRVRHKTAGLEGIVHRALAMVGLEPREFVRRKWFELSGGEAQRVALAARLALRPLVLLLDEPTSNLDVLSAQAVGEAIGRARGEGTTLIVASHDHDWLATNCNREVRL